MQQVACPWVLIFLKKSYSWDMNEYQYQKTDFWQ